MIKNKISMYSPILASAQLALEQENNDVAIAKVKEYAHKMSQFYEKGDVSYDAIWSAYIGAYNASIILGKVGDYEALDYAEKAVELSYKMFNTNGSNYDAIAVVSASTSLLSIIFQKDTNSIPSWKIDNIDTTKIRDNARGIAQELRTRFPNDKEVLDTIVFFDFIDTEFRDEEEKFKIQEGDVIDVMMREVIEKSKNWQSYSHRIEKEKEQQKKKGRQERQFNIIPIVVALVVIIALCCLYFYSIK
ncbi:MAG: hypothetical protein IJE73_08630 [Muribaculaceae bacterium]|nr:hypothetical protein [Muribaculaceae bacterium]